MQTIAFRFKLWLENHSLLKKPFYTYMKIHKIAAIMCVIDDDSKSTRVTMCSWHDEQIKALGSGPIRC